MTINLTTAASPPAAPAPDAGPPSAAVTRSFPGLPESVAGARSWVAGFLPGSPAADDAGLNGVLSSPPPEPRRQICLVAKVPPPAIPGILPTAPGSDQHHHAC
jgi:hypothetical protein